VQYIKAETLKCSVCIGQRPPAFDPMTCRLFHFEKINQLKRTRITESPRKNLSFCQYFCYNFAQNDPHFTDKPILIHWPSLLSRGVPRSLCPHFLDIFQHHIAVAIESFHARQQFAVVSTRYQYLCVRPHSGLKD
jgi:hypothetical protein